MPIREQCENCKDFRKGMMLCAYSWEQVEFDDTPCKKNKAEENVTSDTSEKTSEMASMEGTETKGQKVRNNPQLSTRNLVEGEEGVSMKNVRSTDWFTVTWLILVAVAVIAGGWFGYRYWKSQRNDESMLLAKSELMYLSTDKTMDYLEFERLDADGKEITLVLETKNSQLTAIDMLANYMDGNDSVELDKKDVKYGKDKLKEQIDSIVKLELMSLIAIEPARWKAFCNRLEEADGKLSVALSSMSTNFSIDLTSEQLRQLIEEEEQKKTGLDYFVNNKRVEVLDYARRHFRNDRLLRVKDVVVDSQYVSLWLAYDDSKYKIDKSMLDTTYVRPHFTDGVGEMGSILDGMLAISTRTDKGIAFVYSGTVNHNIDRVQFEKDKVKEIHKDESNRFYVGERKRDQVQSVIRHQK